MATDVTSMHGALRAASLMQDAVGMLLAPARSRETFVLFSAS